MLRVPESMEQRRCFQMPKSLEGRATNLSIRGESHYEVENLVQTTIMGRAKKWSAPDGSPHELLCNRCREINGFIPNIPNILATFAQSSMSPPFRSATYPCVPLFLGMHNLQ